MSNGHVYSFSAVSTDLARTHMTIDEVSPQTWYMTESGERFAEYGRVLRKKIKNAKEHEMCCGGE